MCKIFKNDLMKKIIILSRTLVKSVYKKILFVNKKYVVGTHMHWNGSMTWQCAILFESDLMNNKILSWPLGKSAYNFFYIISQQKTYLVATHMHWNGSMIW